jgi:hypothetical protein
MPSSNDRTDYIDVALLWILVEAKHSVPLSRILFEYDIYQSDFVEHSKEDSC